MLSFRAHYNITYLYFFFITLYLQCLKRDDMARLTATSLATSKAYNRFFSEIVTKRGEEE